MMQYAQYSEDNKTLIKCANYFSGNFVIPDGVTCIKASAFEECRLLSNIIIPNSVVSIGQRAFYRCDNLQSIIIPNGVNYIESEVFFGCEKLISITIPSSVTNIGSKAFSYCTNLQSIIIPNGVKTIGYDSFTSCWKLRSVTIPDSVVSIESGTFHGCPITALHLPDNAPAEVVRAFYNCETLPIIDGLVYAGNFLLRHGYDGRYNFTIKEGTKTIGPGAFRSTNISYITIPSSVTRIGSGAFSGCTHLSSISIPNSVKCIETGTFEHCTNLKTITIPDSIQSIGSKAFFNCKELTTITIPNGITKIEDHIFSYCTNLKSITIPNSVTRLGNGAFENCMNLKTIYLPSNIVFIDLNVLRGCNNLEEIIVPKGQKEKFMQFKALEEYKFLIKESSDNNINISNGVSNNSIYGIDCTDGKSILLHYAQQAEKEKMINRAISLYEDAEKLGSIEAAYRLGVLLIDKDYYKAYFYMTKAAQASYSDAKEKLVYFQSIR